jgi:predicted nuclease of predicted toxin-antitoxin system
VRLLLDQNLSPRLVRLLSDLFPGCAHVSSLGMGRASDTEIWNLAREQGYTIVSKDSDFHQRSFVLGPPPRFIWLRIGNCSVMDTEDLLRRNFVLIKHFHQASEAAFLVLS